MTSPQNTYLDRTKRFLVCQQDSMFPCMKDYQNYNGFSFHKCCAPLFSVSSEILLNNSESSHDWLEEPPPGVRFLTLCAEFGKWLLKVLAECIHFCAPSSSALSGIL